MTLTLMNKKITFGIFFVTILLILGFFSGLHLFPLKYCNEIKKNSQKYNVEKDIIYSIVKIESNFRPKVISHKGAIGLMQIMPKTGEWIASKNKLEYSDQMLLNPHYNLELGTLYLYYLLDRYDNDINKVLIAYNAGPTRLKNESWKEIKETRNYLRKYKIVNFFYKIRLYFCN